MLQNDDFDDEEPLDNEQQGIRIPSERFVM